MMNEFTDKEHYLMDDDLDFIDDLLDTDVFGSYVEEQLDPETLKLLEQF